MIPRWKLVRELKRLKMQFSQWYWFAFGPLLRHLYDLNRTKTLKVSKGRIELRRDAAIVLIYQPTGLLDSLFLELDHLTANGFSPIVVSNARLSDADLQRAISHASVIIQRPNYGYDFGGYRDGILYLKETGIKLENLIVKNDSIWFPLTPDCSLLKDARASKADIYGIFYNRIEKQEHRSHIQSYFYRFGPGLTQSPTFLQYWKTITLTNNKYMVIRQNEIKLTHWFKKRGYTIDYLHDLKDMQAAMASLSDNDLRVVLQYQGLVDTRHATALSHLLSMPADDEWRKAADKLISERGIGKYYLISHPLILFGKMSSPFLKKDRQPMYRYQRREIMELGLDERIQEPIRTEIREWDA